MSDSLSQRFIAALEPDRDGLFTLALALAKTPVAAEGLLQKTLRASFHAYADGKSPVDFTRWIRGEIRAASGVAAGTDGAPTTASAATAATGSEPMPAATWARLAAGVQIEAAKSGASKALNPDSVLLSPDPLLAPKKRGPQEDLLEGLNLNPTSRFVLGVAAALLVGITFSLFYCSRSVPAPQTQPATSRPHP